MAKKKRENKEQQHMSPEAYIRKRGRQLEIGKCYVTDGLFDKDTTGEGYVIVTRNHTGGKISCAIFLVDVLCLGIKDSFIRLRLDSFDFQEILESFECATDMVECSYNEAHNIIYGALAFAEDAGIEPHKTFALTQYMLEEDTDDIPIIEYDFGKNGKHFLIASDQIEASKYLPKLKKLYGNNFKYIVPCSDFGYDDSDYEKSPTYGEMTKYTYNPKTSVTELKLHHPWINEELSKPENSLALDDELTDRILALPKEEVREDLENIILYYTTVTRGGYIPEWFEKEGEFNGIIPVSTILLAEVGNDETSLDVILNCLRQSPDYFDYHFGDFGLNILASPLIKLGNQRLDRLLDFMKESGLFTYAKCLVPEVVAILGNHFHERKAECVEWFKKLIEFSSEVLPEVKYIDYQLAALIASSAIDLGDKVLLPYIRAMFETGCVDQSVVGSIDDVEDMFNNHDNEPRESNLVLEIHEHFNDLRCRFSD